MTGLTLATLMCIGTANGQAPLDEFGFLEDWQILSEDVRLGKVALTEQGLPPGYDTDLDKMTDEAHFRVSIEPENAPPPFNEIHTWLISIETPDGRPVSGADIKVYGGMPLHNHAFATAPETTGELEDGVYALEGIKFSMLGWWTVALGIQAEDKTDRVSFNLMPEP